MKIAVTYENGQVFQHFGHTEQFKIYEAAEGKVVSARVVETGGSGHGALAGFLVYNYHPAKVFMGDTGSLFLGGAVCGMAFALDLPLILILVGIIYIVETLSDIIQIVYFKATHGKRIFRMAPLHHHLEMGGWSEKKVVFVFAGISLVFCILAFFGVIGRFPVL